MGQQKKVIAGRLSLLKTAVISIVLIAFGTIGVVLIRNSRATTTVNCSTTQVSAFRIAQPKTWSNILMMGGNQFITYDLRDDNGNAVTLQPGKYKIYGYTADDHYNHRPDPGDPDGDNQPQKSERIYIKLGDVNSTYRSPNATSDFTDEYDWHTGEGNYKDDDNNLGTVPPEVADDQGEFLGEVITSTPVTQVTFEHYGKYHVVDDISSVMPFGAFFSCSEPLSSRLTVDKTVDANADSTFSETESTNYAQELTWKVVGRNEGLGGEPDAKVQDCLPTGLTYVDGSAAVSSGGGAATYNATTRCVEWTGALNSEASVTFSFKTEVENKQAFIDCLATSVTGANQTPNSCVNPAKIGETSTGSLVVHDEDTANVTIPETQLAIVKTVAIAPSTSYVDAAQFKDTDINKNISWKLVASNTGTTTESDARVVDVFADGVMLSGVTAKDDNGNNLGTATINGSTVVWNGVLTPGQNVTIVVDSKITTLPAFVTCDNMPNYPANTAGDDRCANRATVGVAGTSTTDFQQGSTRSDDAELYAVFAPTISLVKTVDGIDDDAQTTTRFTDRELIKEGVDFTWRIFVNNTGSAAVSDLVIADTMPAGVQLIGADETTVETDKASGTKDVNTTTNTVQWTGSIEPGGSITLFVPARITDKAAYDACLTASSSTTDCINTATAASVSANLNPNNPGGASLRDSANVYAVFAPNPVLTKTVDGNNDGVFNEREEIRENVAFQWRVSVRNDGNDTIEDFRLVDALPDGLVTTGQFVQIAEQKGGADLELVSVDAPTATAVLEGVLPAGAEATIVITTKTDQDGYGQCVEGTAGEYCRNTVTIGRADTTGPLAIKNEAATKRSDDAEVLMNPEGKLSITKEVDGNNDGTFSASERIILDREFAWRIRVTNIGNGDFANAAIRDVLPLGVTLSSATQISATIAGEAAGEIVTSSGTRHAVTWRVDTLAPNSTAVLTIHSLIADEDAFEACDTDNEDADDGLCKNFAVAGTKTPEDDFEPTTDTVYATVTKQAEALLILSKTVDGSDADSTFNKQEAHEDLTKNVVWKISLKNDGAGIANSVALNDIFPTGVTVVGATLAPESAGTLTVETATRKIGFTGTIAPGQEVVITVTSKFDSEEQYKLCDTADANVDEMCTNTASVSYDRYPTKDPDDPDTLERPSLSSSATVSHKPGVPDIGLQKLVNTPNSGAPAEEKDYTIGDEIEWLVTASNTGTADAPNIRLVDVFRTGQQYIEGSAKYEIVGASASAIEGQVSVVNGAVTWRGTIVKGASVRLSYKTKLTTLQNFANCNFTDGNAKDERCMNLVSLYFQQDTTPFLRDTAALKTKLEVILPVTGGDQGRAQIIVGLSLLLVVFATVAASLAIAAKADKGALALQATDSTASNLPDMATIAADLGKPFSEQKQQAEHRSIIAPNGHDKDKN